jgi:hypothetical protein
LKFFKFPAKDMHFFSMNHLQSTIELPIILSKLKRFSAFPLIHPPAEKESDALFQMGSLKRRQIKQLV